MKQVYLYIEGEGFDCSTCAHSEEIQTEKKGEKAWICHRNYNKHKDKNGCVLKHDIYQMVNKIFREGVK